ncbi:ribosomal protein S7 [Lepidopterella palustris CBS 459.81]|uniref:Small ribosomal subunit protein uS7m n=1 Tax=Lepidopterella palustris CBS 459.81 TaxID=1314670 RepID=A0A8E2JFZ0_9PEZI|nr:ribosomal protein S7 [Lepidopterella palustris CBS 459.81]
MPPRLNLLSVPRTIAYRPKTDALAWQANCIAQPSLTLRRNFAESKEPPAADKSKNPDTQPLGGVTEEAAKTSDIIGTEGPDIEQGTSVEEVVKRDKEAQKMLPKVMQDSLKSTPKGFRSFSTTASRSQGMGLEESGPPPPPPIMPGIKFSLPTLPIPSDAHLKYRYDPVVKQVTNLLMRHGKLSVAQRNMSLILTHLRTSPPPSINPSRPLLPGAPPPSHLPLNPILYLSLAIDSVAPLLRLRSQKGAAGGGVALQIPVPLGLRQRRRTAVEWILAAATKRRNRGSGKGGFAQRVAEELISVVEGKSSVWERRNAIHKLGVAARANLILKR